MFMKNATLACCLTVDNQTREEFKTRPVQSNVLWVLGKNAIVPIIRILK